MWRPETRSPMNVRPARDGARAVVARGDRRGHLHRAVAGQAGGAVVTVLPVDERQARRSDAGRLVDRDLRWAHLPDGPTVRVEQVSASGMVTIRGYVGEFAPHLFVVVGE